jgi:preprotein translocase subunit SecG
MYALITVLILIASVLLVAVVVVQNAKGGGLASGFSSSNQIMGVRKTTDFLEKATWGLAGTVVILSIIITGFLPQQQQQQDSEIRQQLNETPVLDPNFGTPDFGTAQPQPSPEGE